MPDESDDELDDGGVDLIDVLRGRFESARRADRGDPTSRERHVEAAFALALALSCEYRFDEANSVLVALESAIPESASTAITMRLRLARELGLALDHAAAIVHLRAAHTRARGLGVVEAERAIELASALTVQHALDDARLTLATSAHAIEAAAHELAAEVAAEHAHVLAKLATGDEAIAHARRRLEHAFESVDPGLVASATSYLGELLFNAGAIAEARELLLQRPPTESDSRRDRALFDAIRRTLGEAILDPPDEPDEPAQLPPRVLAYFTKPTNLARSVIEGGLPDELVARQWAHGTVRSAADLDSQKLFGPVRSFWCQCGWFRGREYAGLTCHRCGVDVVHAAARRTRCAVIELAAPAVHPWYAPAAGVLLGVSGAEALAIPVDELRKRLSAVDLEALAKDIKHQIITAPRARLADEAGRRLALVDAFKHAREVAGTTPASIILDVVLVPPPDAELGVDRARVRAAYARLLAAGDITIVFAELSG